MANTPAPQKPTTLGDALKFIGGFTGFLWGGTIGAEDPETGFLIGAIIGTVLGAIGGWAVSLAVRVAFHVGFLLAALALIAARVYWLFSVATG